MAEKASDGLIYSRLFDAHADGIIILSPDQSILYWNQRISEILGITASEVLGKSLDQFLTFEQKVSFQRNVSNSLKGKSYSSDQVFVTKKDKFLQFAISFSCIESGDTSDVCCLLHLRIIRTEFEKERFIDVIQNSPLPMGLYTKDGTALFFNPAYARLWDVPFSAAERTFLDYNILKDEQLVGTPVMSLIQKAFEGEYVELPVIPYNPARTSKLEDLELDKLKYLKTYFFPFDEKDPKGSSVVMIVQDQTEQKRAQEILVDNQVKFEMLSVGLPGIIYEYHIPLNGDDPSFNYISQGVRQIFGLEPREIMDDPEKLFDLVSLNDMDHLKEALKSTERPDEYWQWSGRFIVNGKVRWIEARSSPGIRKADRIVRYGLITDITDRRSIEDAHKRTEERLRLALEAADLGFWEWDVPERRRIFNPSWASRFGYSEDESEDLFNNWEALIHPDDLKKVKRKMSKYLRKDTDIYDAEYRFMKSDGSYRWVHDRGSGIATDQKGKIIRATGTFVDIHEKKISQDRIQRQEQLFTHLFKNAPVGIVFLDEDMIVRQMNPGFTRIFGLGIKEISGKKLDDIIVPEDLKEEAERINNATKKGKSQKLETHRLNHENQPVPVILYSIPVIFQKQTIGIYGLYVDITDRVKAEKELEVRNLELDNFVYKVSHDLRAPLSSIMGLVNLANHERGSDTVYDYIGMIDNRIKQLDNFISDILSHSKNLKLEVRYSKIDFQAIIDECFNSLTYLPQTGKIKKIITISGSDFYSDEWRISEILRNLISNAVKYYSTRRDEPYIEIDVQIESTYASIYFGDNGIGITEDRLPKVFEMFYRATEHGEGSGIGLYIVKNAIERLGGVIRLKSLANKGTSFEITLPNAIRELDEANTV